ncbi:hypothetical protein TNIN_303731 [Trichonephila inaurata madagascariensis]|uniref:Uncharacterized protein n=1 Tax=Trichonephila inaurata madagascariensis TaxID=2747483 RepID=A0A8X6XYT6_9ARAC|nr:hypothetical protein TNIN_303731 [Trichonephila inaurata madagascariensis]
MIRRPEGCCRGKEEELLMWRLVSRSIVEICHGCESGKDRVDLSLGCLSMKSHNARIPLRLAVTAAKGTVSFHFRARQAKPG